MTKELTLFEQALYRRIGISAEARCLKSGMSPLEAKQKAEAVVLQMMNAYEVMRADLADLRARYGDSSRAPQEEVLKIADRFLEAYQIEKL